MEVFANKHSQDLVDVVDGGEVKGRRVVCRRVPFLGERKRNHVQDGNICNRI